jgi:hypothetical protein
LTVVAFLFFTRPEPRGFENRSTTGILARNLGIFKYHHGHKPSSQSEMSKIDTSGVELSSNGSSEI